MHSVLVRQLERCGLTPEVVPADAKEWRGLLDAVGRAYEHADQDRSLLERSLSLTSEEMEELHRELSAKHESLTSVTEALLDGVVAVSDQGRVMFINSAALGMIGCARGAVEGRVLAEVVPAATEDGRTIEQLLDGVRASASPGEDFTRLILNGDTERHLAFAATPLGGGSGGTVLRMTDITKRVRLEEERAALASQLVELSREAGKAEVATSVLHDVGNVLNSVNIAAHSLGTRLRRSELPGLLQISELLAGHRADLTGFLTEGSRGDHLVTMLDELSKCLSSEHDAIVEEASTVARGVEHIRNIVSLQQVNARAARIVERVVPGQVVDAALELQRDSLARHGVHVVRAYHTDAPMTVDKHIVLQVLVNLIKNAKEAVTDSGGERPEVRVAVARRTAAGREEVAFEVRDNGCGIAAADLTRVFAHGFTTRADGHGFGLHSAANAARSLGGSLTAHSDGPGLGARFELTIPAEAEAPAADAHTLPPAGERGRHVPHPGH